MRWYIGFLTLVCVIGAVKLYTLTREPPKPAPDVVTKCVTHGEVSWDGVYRVRTSCHDEEVRP